MAQVRQRTTGADASSSSSSSSARQAMADSSKTRPKQQHPPQRPRGIASIFSFLKPVLVVALLLPALSHLITDGDSWTFHLGPSYVTLETLKGYFTPDENPGVKYFLTDEQLAKYDGSDPALPIYVALNGSVFDVSANPAVYGPGGGYHVFAGADAARGFVTGCFLEDRTWDLRGVELMFVPVDEELDAFEEGRWHVIKDLTEVKKEQIRAKLIERRVEAWEQVKATIKHWDDFFRNHAKYKYVGNVKHRDINGDPLRPLCKEARRKRPGSMEE